MKSVLCALLVAAPLSGALAAEPLPAVDTLTPASSFAAFVQSDVPADIQRQALRRLWALNPALAGPDAFDMDAPAPVVGLPQIPAVVLAAAPGTAPLALPPADQLTRQSDYTVYLASSVPLAVHQAAIRRLWATHPELSVYSDDPMHTAVAAADSDRPQRRADRAGTITLVSAD